MDDIPHRQHVQSGAPWEDLAGYARAVRTGEHVWVSGTTGTAPDGSIPDGAAAQTRLALDIIAAALADCGASIGDAVMVRISLVDFADFDAIASVLRERFSASRPAMTAVQVAALIDPRHRVEIEVQAFTGTA